MAINPARVNVRMIASAISSSATPMPMAERLRSSMSASSRPRPNAKMISRYIDAIVGYCSGPPARSWAPTTNTSGRKAFRMVSTAGTRRLSRMASPATTVPDASATISVRRNREALVVALTASRQMTNAAANRPAMWNALNFETGATAAEIDIATSRNSHGAVTGVRQMGHCRDHASAAPKASTAATMIASLLLIDWCGSWMNGRVSSNGAAAISTQTATCATCPASAFSVCG